jgi:hypothetical protein
VLTAVDNFVVAVPPDTTARACREAISQFGWRIESDHADEIVIAVVTTGVAESAKITVRMALAGVSTRVTLDGQIGGATPMEEMHLRGQMRRLRKAITQADPQARGEPEDLGLSSERSTRAMARQNALTTSTVLRMALVACVGVAVLVIYLVVTSIGPNSSAPTQPPAAFQQIQSVLQQGTNATTVP